MIDIKEVLSIHEILIEKFGGGSGARDMNALQSAISRPYSTFDIKATQDEKYTFVIAIASGHYKTDDIRMWIQQHLIAKH